MNDLSEERAEVRQRFANMRHFLSLVIAQREQMGKDFGFDEDDEMVGELKHIVAVFREEERILLEMLAEEDVADNPMLVLREARQDIK